MNAHTLRNVAAAAALVTLFALNAQAQSASRPQAAHIPFEFNAGGQTLPAGEYRVVRVNPQSDRTVLALRGTDGGPEVMLITNVVEAGDTRGAARLVFKRYGDQYFLAQVWDAAESTGLELPASPAERRLRRELRWTAPPAQAVVALSAAR